jgi:hypothetical protein
MKVLPSSLLAAVLTLNAMPAQHQDTTPTIDLGGFSLSLGMRQDGVLRKLAVIYELRAMNDSPGNWGVLRKGGRAPSIDRGYQGFRHNYTTGP